MNWFPGIGLTLSVKTAKARSLGFQKPWKDKVRKQMEVRAKALLKENAENLNLQYRAEENAERMFKKLILTDKHLIIAFDEK